MNDDVITEAISEKKVIFYKIIKFQRELTENNRNNIHSKR